MNGQISDNPEGDDDREQGPYPAMMDEHSWQGPRRKCPGRARYVRISNEGQRHYREGIVAKCASDVRVEKAVESAERAAARAVVARESEEGTNGVCALNAGVEDVEQNNADDGEERNRGVFGPGAQACIERLYRGHGSYQNAGRNRRPKKNRIQIKPPARPTPNDTQAQVLALEESCRAPSRSPAWSFPLTWAAYTMETTPVGRQQKMVTNMA